MLDNKVLHLRVCIYCFYGKVSSVTCKQKSSGLWEGFREKQSVTCKKDSIFIQLDATNLVLMHV